jgi:phosphatidylglycerol---prolipoprotein diacylglyceryl transferase
MLTYPHINPVALNMGTINIYWYGVMYVIGFAVAWALAQHRARAVDALGVSIYNFTADQVSDLIFYCALGVILGGRIGYVLIYSFAAFKEDPMVLFKVWEGGMSFHGGLIGVMLAIFFFALRSKRSYFAITDFVAPLAPLGLGLGRIGNFINGELPGRVTTVPWGMVFDSETAGVLPRHPSQLYEAFGEGLVLFLLLWFYGGKLRKTGKVSALFLISYGLMRFGLEFFREPDANVGFVAFNWLTMGQLLSLPMIVFGIILWIWKSGTQTIISER